MNGASSLMHERHHALSSQLFSAASVHLAVEIADVLFQARACVAVAGLARGTDVEIECVAAQ